MSTDTGHAEAEGETATSALETWERWYHVPVIAVAMLFMVASRVRNHEAVAMRDGEPSLMAVDSWYHWRTVEWTAENYPNTMPFDVWTSFPDGRYVGQFGTLFDQLIVTTAMIVGLGDPSTETLYTVAIFAVPVMAALVALPVFFIGRRLGGRLGGVVAVLVLALAPGQFFFRSLVGQLQHHVAEVLFMAIAVLAMMIALRVGEQDRPIYELVAAREWETLKRPAAYSALAGLALTLYIWIWPSGVVLVGIFGIFFAVQLCLDYVRGTSPDHVAFVGIVSMTVAALGTLLLVERWEVTGSTSFSLLQPMIAASVGAGCAFMAWFAREWDRREIDGTYYPIAIVGLLGISFGGMALVLPDLFDTIWTNLTRRVIPFGQTATDLTISEAQPPGDFASHVFFEFRMAFYTMLGGLILLLARPLLGREFRAEHTLVVVWTLFLLSMAATQIRFAYYLLLPVAVLNAVFIADTVRLLNLDAIRLDSLREIEVYQAVAVFLVVMMLFAPMLPPLAAAGSQAGPSAWDRGAGAHMDEGAQVWEGPNHWMAENTPEVGDYGAEHENADQLDYFGEEEYPPDGNFDYPDGSYGVMSWWDYGHLITTQAERIPHSNPFQSNADSSAEYFLAQDEGHGEAILDGIAAGENVTDADPAALEAATEDGDLDEEMRYVMIDDEMAGHKFGAMTQWTGPEYETFYEQDEIEMEGEQEAVPVSNENFDDTMLASLYMDDADGMEHYRLVTEAETYSWVGGAYEFNEDAGQYLPSAHVDERMTDGYDQDVENQTLATQQGEELAPTGDPMVPTQWYDPEYVSSVKAFERVEGATIEGEVDDSEVGENTTAIVAVELETEPGRTFTYTQDADVEEDGTFEMTVPYATDDELGVEDGYTDSSVEATGEYEVLVGEPDGADGLAPLEFDGETAVSETDVIEGNVVDVGELEATDDDAADPGDEDEGDGEEGDGDPDEESSEEESNGEDADADDD